MRYRFYHNNVIQVLITISAVLLVSVFIIGGIAPARAITCDEATGCDQADDRSQQGVSLKPTFAAMEHIEFGHIPANGVMVTDDVISFDVMMSASFLMHAFDRVVAVTGVSMSWRSQGKPVVRDASHEREKSGDDAVVKLGLLLKAEEQGFSPFLPGWMKQVRKNLNFPSESMIYLVADARHAPGKRWVNPYNDRITMVAMTQRQEGDGWTRSSIDFDQPVEVVGVWLMSDGDNTDSSFMTSIRDVRLK